MLLEGIGDLCRSRVSAARPRPSGKPWSRESQTISMSIAKLQSVPHDRKFPRWSWLCNLAWFGSWRPVVTRKRRERADHFGVRGVSPTLDRVERTSKAGLTRAHSKAAETTECLPDGVGPATSRGLVRGDLWSRGCGGAGDSRRELRI